MNFFLDALLPTRCLYCGTLTSSIFCRECESNIQLLKNDDSNAYSMFVYGGILRTLILKAKFEPNESTARTLSHYMKLHLKNEKSAFFKKNYDCVTFVPSHWLRRLTRHFDFASILAGTIANTYRIPLLNVLACDRHDAPLSASSSLEQRRMLVQKRFSLRRNLPLGKKILIVDDIFTTGTTLAACSLALKPIEAEISCFTFAKAE